MNKARTGQGVKASDRTVGEIVAGDFRTSGVFEKHKIDFCCGGNAGLEETCRAKGLDLAAINKELEAVKAKPLERGRNYSAWELPFLADYIVNNHHTYLNENMGPISAYARKIASVHGANHPELIKIAALFDKIASDMAAHMKEEEEVFFPAVKRAYAAGKDGGRAALKDLKIIKDSLVKFGHEHKVIGDATHKLRVLSKDYAIPGDVCNTFVVTYQKLREFEDDLHKHMHLENNILFIKAAEL